MQEQTEIAHKIAPAPDDTHLRHSGKAIGIRLARDGYKVCLNDLPSLKNDLHSVVQEIRHSGRDAIPHTGDVTSRADVKNLVDTSVQEHGPLNTMVANAGIVQVKPLIESTEEDLERMFRINVFGLHNCYAAAARQFISQGKPSPIHPPSEHGLGHVPTKSSGVWKIIGASSISGYRPFPQLGNYSASKYAVRGLTSAWAMEMAQHGITVNAYCPGIVGTKMWEEIDFGIGNTRGVSEKGATMKKFVDEMVLMGRTSVPEDVAGFVSYLAGSDSDYITGQNMIVDGGICFG